MSPYRTLIASVANDILQAVPDALILTNAQNQIIEFNTNASRIFGYRREEVLDRDITEMIIAPAYRSLYEQHRQGLIGMMQDTDAGNRRFTVSAICRDGSEVPIDMVMLSVESEPGTIFVLYARDVTVRRENENRLRRMRARLVNMIANLQGGVILANEDHRIEIVNEEFCDMFQIQDSPDKLIGTKSTPLADQVQLLALDPEAFRNRVREIVVSKQITLGDIIHLTDGRVLSRDYIPIFHQDDYLGYVTCFRDVTKEFETRKRWEQLLNLEELNKEIIRLFLQNDDAEEAIQQTLALIGQLLQCSRVTVFRFREAERILDNTHEWCAPNVMPAIDDLKEVPYGEVVPSLYRMLAEDGIIMSYHISSLPTDIRGYLEAQGVESLMALPLYSDGRLEGFIGCQENRYPRIWLPEEIASFRLIAESYARALERQRTQRDLIEARDTAIRTAQIRSQFVANMSHEIRTPMTGVLGMLELLRESPLEGDQREFAEEAFNSASRLLMIVNDILDFSKLDAGFVELEAETINLAALASEVRNILLIQRSHRAVDIRIDIAPDVPARVKGDATRLRQILTNLMGNAVKFTHEGYVLLKIRLAGYQAGQAKLRFEVIDTGIGITASHLEAIFDSFVQVDSSVTRKYGGTGLGLSITRQLVELMGGSIEVESEAGKGSTFRFSLTMPALEPETAPLTADKRNFEHLRVLVIDDDRASRYLLTQQLEAHGVSVTALNDAQLSLVLAEPDDVDPYDLIFLHDGGTAATLSAGLLGRLTVAQSEASVITLTDSNTPDELRPHQLRRPIQMSALYPLLEGAASAVSQESDTVETPTEKQPERPVHRVLLVEDYALNARLVAEGLASDSMVIDIVENGQEALDQLEQVEYDLILMDMQMPVMNGLEATMHIRASDTAYRDLPILALTASVMTDQRESYIQAGVNDVITKPYVLSELRDLVNTWLNRADDQG